MTRSIVTAPVTGEAREEVARDERLERPVTPGPTVADGADSTFSGVAELVMTGSVEATWEDEPAVGAVGPNIH